MEKGKLDSIRCDNGLEFISYEFQNWVSETESIPNAILFGKNRLTFYVLE